MRDLTINKKVTIILCLLIAATLVAGCTAARKPDVNANKNPVAQENQQAKNLAIEAAKVNNVKSAYVVVSGNMAIVGININKKLEKNETERLKNEVGERLKKSDQQITDVRVSTDADTVTRVRRISDGIAQGKPVSGFNKEINEILRRITPTKE